MKTKPNPWMILLTATGIAIVLAAGNSCTKENEEPSNAFQYEAVQYTIDQPDGTTIILQSRGTGNGTTKAFFDIYIEDGTGNVTAFRNDVWYTFNGTTAENAPAHSSGIEFVSGHIVSIDSNYFLDINGGSDQGGITYQFHTGSIQEMKNYQKQTANPDTIYVNSETGGNIDTGKPDEWDNIHENSFGAIFWNGSKFVTDSTAAHLYFTNTLNGPRLKEHIITEVSSATGSNNDFTGYLITKTVYTYAAPKDANGGIADLGAYFPVKFSVQFTDNAGQIQELRFVPALESETK